MCATTSWAARRRRPACPSSGRCGACPAARCCSACGRWASGRSCPASTRPSLAAQGLTRPRAAAPTRQPPPPPPPQLAVAAAAASAVRRQLAQRQLQRGPAHPRTPPAAAPARHRRQQQPSWAGSWTQHYTPASSCLPRSSTGLTSAGSGASCTPCAWTAPRLPSGWCCMASLCSRTAPLATHSWWSLASLWKPKPEHNNGCALQMCLAVYGAAVTHDLLRVLGCLSWCFGTGSGVVTFGGGCA
mmetsp:Transcript_25749/g.65476  ORF Transcript_25749/g.65476 Transcript_25749/m.65476 type:complete len:244 (-) Transcript_25749:585-1316(-)